MIPAGYEATGYGQAVVLSAAAGPLHGDALVSSEYLPGPFLLVAVQGNLSEPEISSYALYVAPASVRVAFAPGQLFSAPGREVIQRAPVIFAEPPAIPDPVVGQWIDQKAETSFWPWLLEPVGGCLAVLARSHAAFVVCNFSVVCSVWFLRPLQLEEAPRSQLSEAWGFREPRLSGGVPRAPSYSAPQAAAWGR